VIRKRAGELLDCIRGCVARHTAATSPVVVTETLETRSEVQEVQVVKPSPTVADKLWSLSKANDGKSSSAASRSSLFGATLKLKDVTPTPLSGSNLSASRSSLFGSKGIKTSSRSSPPGTSTHFKDVVARIHSSLVIVPSAPQIEVQITSSTEVAVTTAPVDGGTGMQVEIPFIPLSQRQTAAVVDDSIVVVGQARQKKRKRERTKTIDESIKSNGKAKEGEMEAEGEPEAFDFSSVPNILDDVPDSENSAKRVKRKKKEKEGGNRKGNFYGDFPAPPKAHSELKTGNQSVTFK